MLDEREISAAIGSTAYDPSGKKIGTVEHFYLDDRTGTPSWVAVLTGLFGTRHSVAPALDASYSDGALRLPVDADAVKNAPSLAGEHLTPDDESELRRHYGTAPAAALHGEQTVPTAPAAPGTPVPPAAAAPPTVQLPAETPRPPAPAGDGAMTRTEEQLLVGTERVATTRARLVKYVVTEEVQITVPIRREEIRVEQVPVDAPDDGPGEFLVADDRPGMTATGAATGLPTEIVLHTERPVVTVEVVPTERVRLRTDVVQGQETVTEQVQREQIVVDEDGTPGYR
ncbi:MAG: putative conserved domain protein [uncultured Blastococcus sp.]|uniref:Putative conserved domain protein n=1 Tax=uncultured Blastococcus sp. TaxID=217144 RepID=A0A6J4H4L3_9ACTN|nr:MAG: putative conserved domain protein [uncultured Blastococcus sp.]